MQQSLFKIQTRPEDVEGLIEELARHPWRGYGFRLEDFEAGRQIVEAGPQVQSRAVRATISWLETHAAGGYNASSWKMHEALFALLKHKPPLDEADILALLGWSAGVRGNPLRGLPQVVKLVGDHLKKNPLSPPLEKKLEELVKAVESGPTTVEDQRRMMRLRELMGKQEVRLPLAAGDPWADAALSDLQGLPNNQQALWAELLLHCLRASGSTPSKKWIDGAQGMIDKIGSEGFRAAMLRWLPLADQPRQTVARHENGQIPLPANADLLKGLAWACGTLNDMDIARALSALAISAYRRIPGSGPRAVKIGNACFWALGNMPSTEGLIQLSVLKAKIKGTSPQKAIVTAIDAAARRTGISSEDAEELCVPTFGLQEVRALSYALGDVVARIHVVGTGVEQTWERAGRQLASLPKVVKDERAAELQEIAETVKDIRKVLLAVRDRIDGFYLSPRKWTLGVWRQRYLDHPLAGTVARRLIWKFSKGDHAESGIWHEGQIVGRDGTPLAWLEDSVTVELWHPISVSADVVMAWRDWLSANEVQQPFKQAHREIYLLTDAERSTVVYSNRFAAHILRQHQFHALCAARGWKDSLRLMVDDEFPPASRLLAPWGLRAEFWVEGIGNHYQTDTNETGAFLYLSTDQVRFYRSDAVENRAHAGGGGYYARRWYNHGNADPLPLDTIPPLVFSEVMRDVDLFVGVSSLGNDPNWIDGGAGVRYRDYWQGYSFGELNESAKTRRQVLETLIPRLKIADRCRLTDRFLVVSGDLRRYKIHLGSGNILMEPNDQYLCIVPSRGSGVVTKEKLFLPFEGDQTLTVILSKAYLLAGDRKITDPSIVRQLQR